MDLKSVVRTVLDFPIKGITFRDITPVLQNPEYLKIAVDSICNLTREHDFDLILGPESRGFIFGVPLAYKLNKGFIPVRKAGKLPYKTLKKDYIVEYGNDTIEIHIDAIQKGQKVIIVDDLLATGGTCKATIDLVESVGGIVECVAFFIELENLKGRDILKDYKVHSVLKY